MVRQRFEIEHLRSCHDQLLQQATFAAARRAADDPETKLLRKLVEFGDDSSPKRPIATFELSRRPANAAEDVRHRGAAIAAAPAVDERPPRLRFVGEAAFQMVRDVARYICCPAPARFE